MGKIVKLKNKAGDILYPKTILDAIFNSQGKSLTLLLNDIRGSKSLYDIAEDGFFVTDTNGNIGLKYDADGFDVFGIYP